jgi:hypothetical protein
MSSMAAAAGGIDSNDVECRNKFMESVRQNRCSKARFREQFHLGQDYQDSRTFPTIDPALGLYPNRGCDKFRVGCYRLCFLPKSLPQYLGMTLGHGILVSQRPHAPKHRLLLPMGCLLKAFSFLAPFGRLTTTAENDDDEDDPPAKEMAGGTEVHR